MIYVIEGIVGCYSYRQQWIVAAYKNQCLAQAHVEAAMNHAKLDQQRFREMDYDGFADYEGDEGILFKSPWDPDDEESMHWSDRNKYHERVVMHQDLGVLRYRVVKVQLLFSVPVP